MSYENTPMKIQWREIDGRQVPFVLPQYWDTEKRDWVVTSEHDRLPVDARLTGSNVAKEHVLLDAESIAPGDYISTTGSMLPHEDCDEIWFILRSDVFPIVVRFRPYYATNV